MVNRLFTLEVVPNIANKDAFITKNPSKNIQKNVTIRLLNINLEFVQSNIEGEIVTMIILNLGQVDLNHNNIAVITANLIPTVKYPKYSVKDRITVIPEIRIILIGIIRFLGIGKDV